MKLLLIDNYDSYSHILANMLWDVSGEKPYVVKNDAVTLEALKQDYQDKKWSAVVFSPGPGNPNNKGDFGICLDVMKAFPTVPMLGVCLGHQGMGVLEGGDVVPAPKPKHGKRSKIKWSTHPLFLNMPNPFSAVRYHSLVLEEESLPQNIQVLAHSEEDKQVMAIALKNKPFVGVQFHPESVGTVAGKQILKNFVHWADSLVACIPTEKAQGKGSVSPDAEKKVQKYTLEHLLCDWIEPEELWEKLYPDNAYAFWLDSHQDQISYIGLPETVYHISDTTVQEKDEVGKYIGEYVLSNPEEGYRVLSEIVGNVTVQNQSEVPWDTGFFGGLVGYNHYEFGREGSGEENGLWMKVHHYWRIDSKNKELYRCTLHPIETNNPLTETFSLVQNKKPRELKTFYKDLEKHCKRIPSDTISFDSLPGELRQNLNREDYLAAIEKIKTWLQQGETYELCLTNHFEYFFNNTSISMPDLYAVLRKVNPAPYSACFKTPKEWILSSSPEKFLQTHLDKDGALLVSSEPIKGTREKRRENNFVLKEELLQSSKEDSELLMITDLLRNDLAKVCQPGSVEVLHLKKASEYATVLQLSSTIQGVLQKGKDSVELLQACFPGGSITGAPKKRTMEWIQQLEQVPRGVYTGTMGYLGYENQIHLNIAIRTLWGDSQKVCFGAGGAIVFDSDSEAEYAEMCAKAYPLVRALTIAEAIVSSTSKKNIG